MKIIKKQQSIRLIIGTAILSLLLTYQRAEARFGGGGGGHFGGGGGHFGGGNGYYYSHSYYGSSGIGDWFYIFCILVIIIFFASPLIITLIKIKKYNRSIKLTDEQKQTFKAIFMQLQHTWPNNDLAICRALLTDGFYQKNQAILDDYQSKLITNQLDNIRLLSLRPVRLTKTTIAIKFTATLKDQFTSITTGERVDEVGAPCAIKHVRTTYFVETWTFSTGKAGYRLRSIKPIFEIKLL